VLESSLFNSAYHRKIPDRVRSKAYVCSRSIVEIAGSSLAEGTNVRLFHFFVCYRRCSFCDGLITRTEESYRVCVCV